MSHDDPTQLPEGPSEAGAGADETGVDTGLDTVLDELLASARWPEPTAESERRLRESWRALSVGPRLQIGRWWIPAAAAVAISLSVFGTGASLRVTASTRVPGG